MNLQFFLEKLMFSKEFQDFKKTNPSAYLCSGFFSIDKKGKDNKQHFDFFDSDLNKMFSFQMGEEVSLVPVEDFNPEFEFTKIKDNVDFEFGRIEKLIEEKMKEENINKKIEKILLSLQSKDGKHYLVGTVFISNLSMIKIRINLDEESVEEFDKKSFFDMLKFVKKENKN